MAVGGRTDREGEDTGGVGYGGGNGSGMDAAEAAGGPENEATEMDIASALADALAGANVDDFGAYAAQDVQNIEDQGMAFNEQQAAERQALADRIAEIDAAIQGSQFASGFSPQDPYGTGGTPAVDDFSGGNPYAEQQIAANEFADWGAPTPTGIEETQMGMAAPMFGQTTTPGTDFFGNQDPTEGYVFGQGSGQQGDPSLGMYSDDPTFSSDYGTYATPQASPYGAMSELGLTGHQFAQGNPIGYAGPNSQFMTTSQNVEDQIGGEWNGAAAVDSFTNMPGALSASQSGMIAAGTTSPEQAAIEADITAGQDFFGGGNVSGVSAPAASPAQSGPGTDFFGDDGNVGVATDSPAGTRMTGEEVNVYGKEQVDKSIMEVSSRLDQKAKAAREKYGTFSKEYQSAQRLANAFKSLDAYGQAYSATQGGSFMGQLLSGALPLGSALKGIQGWLTSKGMYSKEMGQDLLGILEKAQKDGNLNEVLRDLNQSGEGGMEAEMAAQEGVASFIQRYPWAAELDPKYIQYLIDNPAELQDLLGQNAGG